MASNGLKNATKGIELKRRKLVAIAYLLCYARNYTFSNMSYLIVMTII